ncbi:hypothetical protein ABQJ54_07240 [Rhodanobacter sp. Si-c]|uniref:Uncharacterized protein n=1 Tax=Rhodanobacter lycopersici TaxID=3162487 RepID=A0ABV3QCR6_9GAMM
MKMLAGGAIAVVLLVFYVLLVHSAVHVVNCVSTSGCTGATVASFNDVKSQAMSVLGGLVSALIISELAITKPGEAPAARILAAASDRAKNVFRWTTWLYVGAWLVTGAWAFWTGLSHPSVLPALTSVGQSWLGLAVASAYAYFGISPANG